MEKDLISVIIPVYNVAEFLPYSLESIINQKYQNLEIIIVNDGSTDKSLEICNEYAGNTPLYVFTANDRKNYRMPRNMWVNLSSDVFAELEKVFGKGASWEMTGAKFGSDITNEYEFRLKLPKVEPMEQASFDELKVKATPFTNKLLEEMKKVGIKNPVVKLKIVDKNSSEFKGSESLKTEYRLTL